MDITVRKLGEKDRKELKKIRLEALQLEPLAFGTSYEEGLQLTDEQRKQRATPSTAHTYGVFVGHEMYGMAGWKYSMKLKMKHVATIWGVFISSELRGKGVAKQLFEAMLFEIQKEKFTKIQLMVNESQKSAYHFYKKVGFIEVGRLRGELLYNGTYYDELIMEYYFQ